MVEIESYEAGRNEREYQTQNATFGPSLPEKSVALATKCAVYSGRDVQASICDSIEPGTVYSAQTDDHYYVTARALFFTIFDSSCSNCSIVQLYRKLKKKHLNRFDV